MNIHPGGDSGCWEINTWELLMWKHGEYRAFYGNGNLHCSQFLRDDFSALKLVQYIQTYMFDNRLRI